MDSFKNLPLNAKVADLNEEQKSVLKEEVVNGISILDQKFLDNLTMYQQQCYDLGVSLSEGSTSEACIAVKQLLTEGEYHNGALDHIIKHYMQLYKDVDQKIEVSTSDIVRYVCTAVEFVFSEPLYQLIL
jgi:hypothetical protein